MYKKFGSDGARTPPFSRMRVQSENRGWWTLPDSVRKTRNQRSGNAARLCGWRVRNIRECTKFKKKFNSKVEHLIIDDFY